MEKRGVNMKKITDQHIYNDVKKIIQDEMNATTKSINDAMNMHIEFGSTDEIQEKERLHKIANLFIKLSSLNQAKAQMIKIEEESKLLKSQKPSKET